MRSRIFSGVLIAGLALGCLHGCICAEGKGKCRSATAVEPKKWFYFHQKHKAFLARAKEGGIDLLFVGDSITDRWDKEVWKEHYGKLNAANFGIDGDRTQFLLWRIQDGELEGISPRVVVLLIGINNMGENWDGWEDVAEGIKANVNFIRKKLPKTKILLLGVFPCGQFASYGRKQIKRLNGAIAKLDDGKAIQFLDFGDKFLGKDKTISSDVMHDYLHLTKKGYKIWAEAMGPLLKEMIGLEVRKGTAKRYGRKL